MNTDLIQQNIRCVHFERWVPTSDDSEPELDVEELIVETLGRLDDDVVKTFVEQTPRTLFVIGGGARAGHLDLSLLEPGPPDEFGGIGFRLVFVSDDLAELGKELALGMIGCTIALAFLRRENLSASADEAVELAFEWGLLPDQGDGGDDELEMPCP